MRRTISFVFLLLLASLSFFLFQIYELKLAVVFNSIDSTIWKLKGERFSGNGTNVLKKMLTIEDTTLVIALEKNKNPNKAEQPYNSGGVVSMNYFRNGVISVRMKNGTVSGVMGSFNLINQWKPEGWEQKEIGISFLGKTSNEVVFSTKHNKKSGEKFEFISDSYSYKFEYPSSRQYHDYDIKWLGNRIEFYLDKKLIFNTDKIIFDEPMLIQLTQWAANKEESTDLYNWLGPVDEGRLPSKVFFKWVKVRPIVFFDEVNSPFRF